MQRLEESILYEFEGFRLDTKSHRLSLVETDETVALTPKVAELLIYLVRNPGRILLKDELIEAVWENAFVEESNLSQSIFVLRKALGEDNKSPRFIRTAPNRGYEFIAIVTQADVDNDILDDDILSGNFNLNDSDTKYTATDPKSTYRGRKWMWIALPLLMMIGLGAIWFYPAAKPPEIGEIKTIAILPFEDLSEGQTEKYLGISLADSLEKRFGNLKQITVRPTSSTLKYIGSNKDAQKIGRELKVDAVLDGRIQHIGDRVRVNVQLTRTADNATVWTQNFDDLFTNFFAVQDSISRRVVESLALRIDDNDRRRFDRRGTESAEAYQEYLLGRFFWNKRTGENLQKAIGHFESSINKDPNFALAYVGLSDCYQLLAIYGVSAPDNNFPKARAAAEKALSIDDQLAEAHASLAYTQAFYDWNWTVAEASFKRSIELNPHYATAHHWYGEYLAVFKRFDEARAEYVRAREIDPVSPIILSAMAGLYDMQQDYDNSIDQSKRLLDVDPNFGWAHFWMGMGYEAKKMDAEASESLAKAMIEFGEPSECAAEVSEAFRKGGLRSWWQKRLEQIETRPHLKNFSPYFKALVQIRLGDKERTLASLEQSFQQHDYNLAFIRTENLLEPVMNDPRYQDVIKRMGLDY